MRYTHYPVCDLRVGTFQTPVKDPMNGATHSPATPWFLGQRSCLKFGMPMASFYTNKTSIHVAENVETSMHSYENFSKFLPKNKITNKIKCKEASHQSELMKSSILYSSSANFDGKSRNWKAGGVEKGGNRGLQPHNHFPDLRPIGGLLVTL